jgi:Na+/melibiose symporter-like transporter
MMDDEERNFKTVLFFLFSFFFCLFVCLFDVQCVSVRLHGSKNDRKQKTDFHRESEIKSVNKRSFFATPIAEMPTLFHLLYTSITTIYLLLIEDSGEYATTTKLKHKSSMQSSVAILALVAVLLAAPAFVSHSSF